MKLSRGELHRAFDLIKHGLCFSLGEEASAVSAGVSASI